MAGSKKVRRNREPLLSGKRLDRAAPAPWDSVFLPLIDSLDAAIILASRLAPDGAGNGDAAAKLIYQERVLMLLHQLATIRKIFGLSSGPVAKASSDDFPQSLRHDPSMAWEGETPEYKAECGARLRRARKAVGYESLRAFADDTQTDEDNLGNWERGVSQVPPSYVALLKRTFGIDHAWIYDEDAATLPPDLRKELLTKDRRKGE